MLGKEAPGRASQASERASQLGKEASERASQLGKEASERASQLGKEASERAARLRKEATEKAAQLWRARMGVAGRNRSVSAGAYVGGGGLVCAGTNDPAKLAQLEIDEMLAALASITKCLRAKPRDLLVDDKVQEGVELCGVVCRLLAHCVVHASLTPRERLALVFNYVKAYAELMPPFLIETVLTLGTVVTAAGRCKALVRLAFNQSQMPMFLTAYHKLVSEVDTFSSVHMYTPHCFALSSRAVSSAVALLSSLNNVNFAFVVENSALDVFPSVGPAGQLAVRGPAEGEGEGEGEGHMARGQGEEGGEEGEKQGEEPKQHSDKHSRPTPEISGGSKGDPQGRPEPGPVSHPEPDHSGHDNTPHRAQPAPSGKDGVAHANNGDENDGNDREAPNASVSSAAMQGIKVRPKKSKRAHKSRVVEDVPVGPQAPAPLPELPPLPVLDEPPDHVAAAAEAAAEALEPSALEEAPERAGQGDNNDGNNEEEEEGNGGEGQRGGGDKAEGKEDHAIEESAGKIERLGDSDEIDLSAPATPPVAILSSELAAAMPTIPDNVLGGSRQSARRAVNLHSFNFGEALAQHLAEEGKAEGPALRGNVRGRLLSMPELGRGQMEGLAVEEEEEEGAAAAAAALPTTRPGFGGTSGAGEQVQQANNGDQEREGGKGQEEEEGKEEGEVVLNLLQHIDGDYVGGGGGGGFGGGEAREVRADSGGGGGGRGSFSQEFEAKHEHLPAVSVSDIRMHCTIHTAPSTLPASFQCSQCSRRVQLPDKESKRKKAVLFCHFTNRLFCDQCHHRSKRVLPGPVAQMWDFTKFEVCDLADQFLGDVYAQPSVELRSPNKTVVAHHKTFARMLKYRGRLARQRSFVLACDNNASLLPVLEGRMYLLTAEEYVYSLEDLVLAHKGKFVPLLKSVFKAWEKHIVVECEACRGRGSFCEAGRKGNCLCAPNEVLFPFQNDRCSRCAQCKALYHRKCFKGACVRCDEEAKDEIASVESDLSESSEK